MFTLFLNRSLLGLAQRRRAALVAGAGFEVVPWGADDRSFGPCRGLESWVPSVGALEASGLAVKEHLGYWVQVVLGK